MQQLVEALCVNGGVDDDDEESCPAGAFDWTMHIVALPWKLLFALVPPIHYCGGWLCFFVALLMIGAVTVMIGDVATCSIAACASPEEITAITFVALGTSMPDTFASKSAAQMDTYADAAVGNVTGSNSVNIFLGLGLPWMIAAIQWKVAGVKSGRRFSRWTILASMTAWDCQDSEIMASSWRRASSVSPSPCSPSAPSAASPACSSATWSSAASSGDLRA